MPDPQHVLGWDIGGAHVKAALLDPAGQLQSVMQLPCPLWKGLDHLQDACMALLDSLPHHLRERPLCHAITMTGEMADLFPDRASGVAAIVASLDQTLSKKRRGDDLLRFYAGAAGFVDAASSLSHAGQIASANWLATASFLAGVRNDGILVDIGSTTTDLIPFAGGTVRGQAASDSERLTGGGLVYAGVVRTPLMALAGQVPYSGAWRSTMNEHFACSADLFRVLGELDESTDAWPAADNGPKTFDGSARRLLRMVGEDLAAVTRRPARRLAMWYRRRLLHMIEEALSLTSSRCDIDEQAPLVAVGIGRFLVADLAAGLRRPWLPGEDLLCPEVTDAGLRNWAVNCAPCVAVARLAQLAESACR
jgi:probable H4MPT-linked C1 transfer pathway protein